MCASLSPQYLSKQDSADTGRMISNTLKAPRQEAAIGGSAACLRLIKRCHKRMIADGGIIGSDTLDMMRGV